MTNTVNELFENIPALLLNFLIAVGAIFIGLLIKFILSRIFRYYAATSDLFLVKAIIRRLHKAMFFFLPLLMLSITSPLMRMDELSYEPFRKIIQILFTTVFAIILIQCIRILEDYFYYYYD